LEEFRGAGHLIFYAPLTRVPIFAASNTANSTPVKLYIELNLEKYSRESRVTEVISFEKADP